MNTQCVETPAMNGKRHSASGLAMMWTRRPSLYGTYGSDRSLGCKWSQTAAGRAGASMLALALIAGAAHADTFTVDTTADTADLNIGDGDCDVDLAATGFQCTLRAAIQEANFTPGEDLIRFFFFPGSEVQTISPTSALPDITDTVTIDGYTQPGTKANTKAAGSDAVLKIELNGTNAGSFKSGLVLRAPNCVIKGLAINRFGFDGIFAVGGGGRIEGNFIGTDPSGTKDLGNFGNGVEIAGPGNNTVGGTTPAARNVISGNGSRGITSRSAGTQVLGNFIGTKKDGTSPLGNSGSGVDFTSASNSTIGNGISGGVTRSRSIAGVACKLTKMLHAVRAPPTVIASKTIPSFPTGVWA